MTGRPSAFRAVPWGLLAPGFVLFAVGFMWPMARLARMSLGHTDDIGVLSPGPTLASYRDIVTDPYNLLLIGHSFLFSAVVAALSSLLSYPASLMLHRLPERRRARWLLLTISPLFVSSIVRTYGWTILLGRQGLVNDLLLALGWIATPLRLSNNWLGCVIGMVQILLPFVVLSQISGFGRLTRDYEESALTLGAGHWARLRHIAIPLTLPGIGMGFAIGFVLAISSFVTPQLLGGGRVDLLATEIYNEAVVQLDWPLASALAILLLAGFCALIPLWRRSDARRRTTPRQGSQS